ncbi:MAG: TonB-dependent receptor [Leptospiraceae bacterium]|nr:TonB-dependent receptor [Leptospiraceae bacterium]
MLRLINCASLTGILVLLLSYAGGLRAAPSAKTIMLARFQPYQSGSAPEIDAAVRQAMQRFLEAAGYRVVRSGSLTLQGAIEDARGSGADFVLSGYYRRGQINLELFGQIYDPETGRVIDAINVSDNLDRLELEGVGRVEIDRSELKEPDSDRIEEFARKMAIRVRSNPHKQERRFNIDDNLLSLPISRDIEFPVSDTKGDSSEDVFQVLGEQDITVASNVVRSVEKQPVSVSIIGRRKIQLSGARTLNELLMLYVPGFFMVEDQDDVIAAFRGLAPDNNAKVLLLLNGQNMNTEWFWGPPDGILQGIDLEFIERIEVIRGPGSVTLGQGALLGVINVVTANGNSSSGTTLTTSAGKDGYGHLSFQTGIRGQDLPQLKAFAYVGRTYYPGQELRNDAYARDKGYEGVDDLRLQRMYDYQIKATQNISSGFETVVTEAGNPVFQQDGLSLVQRRTVYTSGNRLKRTDNTTALSTLEYGDFGLDLFYTDQQRDLYNFYRDRNEVQNIVKHLNGKYRLQLGSGASLKFGGFFTQDDIILHSHSGFVMGGTREERYGASMLLNWETSLRNRMAIGAEYRKYDMGLPDKNGNNFIVNKADATLLGDVNRTHQYVYTNTIDVGSFFVEDFYSITDSLDLFGAFRYDKQRYWGSNVSPRLGAIYQWSRDLRFRFSYQEGFRGSPGVAYSGGFQKDGHLRTDNFDDIETAGIPNPDGNGNYENIPRTKPEKMKSFELAANYRLTGHWELDGVAFYNRVKNIIDVGVLYQDPLVFVMPRIGNDEPGDWNGFWFYKNNIGEVRQVGAEFGISFRSSNLEAGLNHSVVRVVSASSQNIGGMYLSSDAQNKHFRAYPENVTRLFLLYSPWKPLTASLTYLFFPNWYSPNGNRVEGSQILNAGIAYEITEQMELSIIGKNLLNYTNPFPMNANAGGRDLSDGSPSLEETTYWVTFRFKF